MAAAARIALGVAFVFGALSFAPADAVAVAAQRAPASPYEEVLDVYVRDGYVYYRALKLERGRLDRYVGSLASASLASAPTPEQIAFWLNAYNALVLKTVIDSYPIAQQRSREFPAHSIRQIPGAFERRGHPVAGKILTLDQIEQTVLSGFGDPRVFFALGRGSVGGGRLRSEPFTAADLDRQLTEVASECLTRAQCISIDRTANVVYASAIFSWRSAAFIDAYGSSGPAVFASRSPIERAILAFAQPKLLATERDFLEQNQFKVEYAPFDWTLNDLTGRGGR